MARALFPAQAAQNYTESKWSLADDNAQDETKPVAGDSITLTVNSGTVTVDDAWAAASLAATGASTWDFANQLGTVTGNITLDDITATWTGQLLTVANLDVGANGTLTLAGISALIGNIEIDAGGELDMGGNDLNIVGNFIYVGGTISNPGDLTMIGDADIDISSSGNLVGLLTIVAGVTIQRVSSVNATGLAVAATGTLSADNAANLMNVRPVGDHFVQVLGDTTTAPVKIWLGASSRENNLDVSNVSDLVYNSFNQTLTWSGLLEVDALSIMGNGEDRFGRLLMAADGYSLGAVLLGDADAANRIGKLDLAATVGSMTSLAQARAADTTNCELELATSNLTLSGTIDGTEVDVTAAGANIIGGTLTDVDSTGIIHSWGSTLSGTNSVDVTKESSLGGATANVGTGIGMAA